MPVHVPTTKLENNHTAVSITTFSCPYTLANAPNMTNGRFCGGKWLR
jgi:hypothetical protein